MSERKQWRYARETSIGFALALSLLGIPSSHADWRAASADVETAAHDRRIAQVLDEVNKMDAALVADDHATFTAALADDLAVNNPQNSVSVRGATNNRNKAGLISYSRYTRTIEYAGMRGDMVVLMGLEVVVPKGDNPQAGKEVKRRFTDLWRQDGGRWRLTIRQATVIEVK